MPYIAPPTVLLTQLTSSATPNTVIATTVSAGVAASVYRIAWIEIATSTTPGAGNVTSVFLNDTTGAHFGRLELSDKQVSDRIVFPAPGNRFPNAAAGIQISFLSSLASQAVDVVVAYYLDAV